MHSFRTDNALKEHERLCNNHDYCEPIMPSEDKNIVKYNHGEKSLEVANVIYFDLETLQVKNESCSNDPKKSHKVTKTIHEICGSSMNLVRSYDKNIHKYYIGKDCLEKFNKDLQTLAMEVINTEKKEMIPLTNNEIRYYETRKYCHICRKKLYIDENDKKYNKYHQVKDHDHYTGKFRGAAHSICNLRYSTTKEILVLSHNSSNYDYHFIINELVKGLNSFANSL